MSLEAVDDFGHSSDATETSEDSAIEKVIKLAKQYAAGTPPKKNLRPQAAASCGYQKH